MDETEGQSELRLMRAQLESLAKREKEQLELFEKIAGELRDMRAALVVLAVSAVLGLLIYAIRG